MGLSSLSPTQLAGGQIALAVVLAIVGFALLLPRPRGRFVPGGIAALVASISVLGAWIYTTYGAPMPDMIGSILFAVFSLGAVGFGTVLVVQKNPARGAIAFAFVILNTCGLFLLLAAPFLMAATIIVYAGAIIVTFLFVLMLSQTDGPSNENDRSREPWFGSLAGFAFAGLLLFTIYLTALGNNPAKAEGEATTPKATQPLPAQVLTNDERKILAGVLARLESPEGKLPGEVGTNANRLDYFESIRNEIAAVMGSVQSSLPGSIRTRLEHTPRKPGEVIVPYRIHHQTQTVLERTKAVRIANERAFAAVENHSVSGNPSAVDAQAELTNLRTELVLLSGSGELPARNVSNIGYMLYSSHLLAVELAGTLLLVATIGAVAITRRKGAA